MKRRELKKRISILCGELFTECVSILSTKKDANQEAIEGVMVDIFQMQNEMVTRLSHVEPGSTKMFFAKLRDDLSAQTDAIIDKIKELA